MCFKGCGLLAKRNHLNQRLLPVERVGELSLDVVVMDIPMPDLDGVSDSLISYPRKKSPDVHGNVQGFKINSCRRSKWAGRVLFQQLLCMSLPP